MAYCCHQLSVSGITRCRQRKTLRRNREETGWSFTTLTTTPNPPSSCLLKEEMYLCFEMNTIFNEVYLCIQTPLHVLSKYHPPLFSSYFSKPIRFMDNTGTTDLIYNYKEGWEWFTSSRILKLKVTVEFWLLHAVCAAASCVSLATLLLCATLFLPAAIGSSIPPPF